MPSRFSRVLLTALACGGLLAGSPRSALAQGRGDGQGTVLSGGGSGQGARGGGLPGGRNGAPPRDAAAETTGSGVIRGRVVAADTGSPVRRAQVRAAAAELRVARLVSTDAQGRFELRDLPGGRWTLTASKAGFVTLQYGQRRPFESGQQVTLADGETMDRADFSLPRGSAITGKVFDEYGDPVAGARVQVMRYQMVQGQRRLTPAGAAGQSDDTGAFRVFGLAPGDYYVSATLRAGFAQQFGPGPGGPGGPGAALALFGGPGAEDSITYAPTFYPGTGNVAEAQRITLALGQEQGNVNFALLPVKTVRITGLALDSTGSPVANGLIALTGGTDTTGPLVAPVSGGRTRGDGSFTLTNVAPGSYTLTATAGQLRRGNGDVEMASMPLVVGTDDLTGLTIVTGRGGTLTGTLATAEGTVGELKTGNLQIVAQTLRPEVGPGFGTRPARLDAAGAFQMTGLSGPRLIRVNGLPQEWTLKSVLLNSTDVTDTGIDFKGSEEISGLQILVTDRIGTVSGRVLTARGEPTRDYTVVIFPDDAARWAFPSRFVRSGRADQQGQFRITALPPDDHYLAVAVDYLEDGEGSDPQFLEQIKSRAARFGLTEGESKALDLTIVTR